MIKLVKMQGKTLEDYKHIGLTNWGDVVLEPVKCEVYKEDNGQYYLSAELPIEYSNDIQQGDIIIVKLPILQEQCFIVNNKFETRRRIYIDNAKHISFLSDFILCTGGLALTAELIEKKLDRFVEGTVLTNKSNIESTAMYLDRFEYARLTDVLETIAKTANLHIIRDNLQIGLTDKIGQDRGLVFKYDKNIKEFKRIENWDDVVTELNYTSSENDVYVNDKGEKEYFKYVVEHDYPIEYRKFKTFSLSPYSADEVQHLDDLLNKDAGTKEGTEDGGYYKLIDNLRRKIEDKKDDIEDKKDEIRTAKEELEDLRDNLSTEKDTLIDKQIALDWHVMYVESLGKTEEEYDGGTTYKFLKDEYDYQKSVCDNISSQIADKKKEIKTLNSQLDKLRQTDFAGMKATIADYKSLCKSTEKEIARIKVEDCDEQAKQYISEHRVPEITYYVDGYLQTDEYVDIGDTVKIINKDTNTNLTANVTSFKYDCIAKKYKSVVFGNIKRISDALSDFAIRFNRDIDTDISFYPSNGGSSEEDGDFLWEYIGSSAKSEYANINSIGSYRYGHIVETQNNEHTYIDADKLYVINIDTKEISAIKKTGPYAAISQLYIDNDGKLCFWGVMESNNKDNWFARLYSGCIEIEGETSANIVSNGYVDNYWDEPYDGIEVEYDGSNYIRRLDGVITKRDFFNFESSEIINNSFLSEIVNNYAYKDEYRVDNIETIVNNGRIFLYVCYYNINGKNDVINCMYEYKNNCFELSAEYIATASGSVSYRTWNSGQILKTDRYIFFTAAILNPSNNRESVIAFDMNKNVFLECKIPGIDYSKVDNDNYFTNGGKLYYLYNTGNTDADGNYIIDFWELHR